LSVTVSISPRAIQLVQQSELDPQFMFQFSGSATADGTGGALTVNLDCPADTSVLWILLGGFIGGVTSSEVQYNVALEGTLSFLSSKPGRPINAALILEPFVPPIVMLNPQLPGGTSNGAVSVDNVNTEDLSVQAIAYGWEAHVGRNLPQRFFWPATLA